MLEPQGSAARGEALVLTQTSGPWASSVGSASPELAQGLTQVSELREPQEREAPFPFWVPGLPRAQRALFPGVCDAALLLHILIHMLPEGSEREKALKRISRILFLFGDKIQPLSVYGQNMFGIAVHSDQPLETDWPRGTPWTLGCTGHDGPENPAR